mmetsp:Transcript_50649/g.99041  ORF Transcript_50649/g.99041 Transcript_50649/m.99041 type:complete len:318 (+) Transcript_50649:82-1035(+)|eukprot:CAMPEP_0194317238 /NCGR_PEP_ID=MMETSP0171-20130528/13984_1 /TAXON_ID=218684 /ORGANISM="Corethron pennatum, Strain L29A3" /LENGTH=317 /DNA_ID=CAMNT_0039073751 /DNA_START=10 /DNA_END=963 /DNA_ORIENTATION=+
MATLTRRTVVQRYKPKKFDIYPLGGLNIFDEEKPLLESLLADGGAVDRPPGYRLTQKIPSILLADDTLIPSLSSPAHSPINLGQPESKKNHRKKSLLKKIHWKIIPRRNRIKKTTVDTFDKSFGKKDSRSVGDRNHEIFEDFFQHRVTFNIPLDDEELSPDVSISIRLSQRPCSQPLTPKEEGTSQIPHMISYEQDDIVDSNPSRGRVRDLRGFYRRFSSSTSDGSFGGTIPHLLSFENDELGQCHENCGFIRKRDTRTVPDATLQITKFVEATSPTHDRRKLVRQGTSETTLIGLKFIDEGSICSIEMALRRDQSV